ncbi:hypothetical protein [Exiguobacterium algae]|uniref:hypothetical protein n=1 Tax=Exiguobacterium algae TaxID=2751250 RepID=UPI001BEC1973|nr:hypothetical protein [Exiguobacterium algae]
MNNKTENTTSLQEERLSIEPVTFPIIAHQVIVQPILTDPTFSDAFQVSQGECSFEKQT